MASVGARCLVTLDEARDFLKRTNTDDDDAIAGYCDMVTALVEMRTRRKLKSRTYSGTTNNEAKLIMNGTGTHEILMREYPVTNVTAVDVVSYDQSVTRTMALGGYRILDGGRAVQVPNDVFDKGQSNIEMTCVAGYNAADHARDLATLKTVTLRWIQVLWQDKDLAVGRGSNIAVGGESLSFLGDAVPKDILTMLYPYERW